MIIQLVLAVILLFLIAQVASQPIFSRLMKVAGLALVATGIVFVFYPALTNSIAQYLGVGRGADLFLYLAISGGSVVVFKLYIRLRSLELREVELVRQLAIQEAQVSGLAKD